LTEANVLEKLAVSIFRAEAMSWDSDYIGWQDGKSEGKSQSRRSEVAIELG
jgi:hypothetical protein